MLLSFPLQLKLKFIRMASQALPGLGPAHYYICPPTNIPSSPLIFRPFLYTDSVSFLLRAKPQSYTHLFP